MLIDVFRRHDIGGLAKAAWVVFVIVLPFLGVLDLPDRRARRACGAQRQAGPGTEGRSSTSTSRQAAGGSAAEIAKAKELLDAGTITQAEFDAIKAKAVA